MLGLPFLDRQQSSNSPRSTTVSTLVFFGRLETRKGIDLFNAGLRLLFSENAGALRNLTEIVLLGAEQETGWVERVRRELRELQLKVVHVGDLDSERAVEFLTEHAGDSLVVVPSPVENFPYTVIEASRICGLKVLCSCGGGIPEIFNGRGDAQLFEPFPRALSTKLEESLQALPEFREMAAYDADSANSRWLEFHRTALLEGKHPRVAQTPVPATVDVCIPHFNQASYLADLLKGLEQQTVQGFGVIVIDDGSSPVEKAEFERLGERYRERGWTFIAQTNSFVDAARNRAASLSKADYLLFIDADDFPTPETVERMLDSIALSGDDCLVAAGFLIDGQKCPYDFGARAATAEVLARYMPLGPDLVCGLLDPNILGPSMILIRRSVFDAIGGYREVRGAAHEDWELQIRLVAAGYHVDVLPEFLLYFRQAEGGLSRTSSEYEARQRLNDTYEDALGKVGLRGVATAVVALLKRRQELEAAVKENEEASATRLHSLVGELLRRKLQR